MSRTRAPQLRWLTQAVRAACYTLLLGSIPYAVHAGPEGGVITAGAGGINQSGLSTTINQTTQNMAIDWQSYNVNVDERVQYIQPNASSISLNRILSNTGSTIAGRIDANGQVILVNPNGVFFTPTSVLNVGGIIASGLDINTADFMNGNYIFNEVLGSDGAVINSGTINASLGGNVALLGRSVENNGLISANLGSVNLAAGKQAVLTFDNNGLLGVRISQEILQNELGVDAAVLNSGDIHAASGRVLLTGSVSRDVFSQAVNNGDMQASSVVVNEDGSFTLGAGADVINSGTVNVSSDTKAGQVVLLGENITSSGNLNANGLNTNGGNIELHSQHTTLLTQNSNTTARAEASGSGGDIKVLGERVGVFDQARVDASGFNGGGEVLIGGDYQGNNVMIKNASRTSVAPEAQIYADALTTGDGGRVIVWANEYTRYFGHIFARGGVLGGNGGFAEVSGKEGMEFVGDVDLSATLGHGGMLLLDPKNITISTNTTTSGATLPGSFDEFADLASSDTVLNNSTLANRLTGFDVALYANNDITFAASLTPAQTTSGTSLLDNDLTLLAGRSIILNNGVNITLDHANFSATINANTTSGNRDAGAAEFTMGTGSSIVTSATSTSTVNSGTITISTGGYSAANASIGDITLNTLNSSVNGVNYNGAIDGGNVSVTNASGDIILNGDLTTGGEGWVSGTPSSANGGDGGAVTLTANTGTITLANTASINANGGAEGSGNNTGGTGGSIDLTANTINITGVVSSNGGTASGGSSVGGTGGDITFIVGNELTVEADITSNRGTGPTNGSYGNIFFNGDSSDNIFNINNNITLTGLTVTISGLGGNDTIVRGGGSATDTTWTVFDFGTGADGDNDGTLAFGSNTGSNALRFVDVENLIGSSAADSFIIENTGSLSGLLDGGAGFADTLTINSTNSTVQLGDRAIADAITDVNLNVNHIETITANTGSISNNSILADNIASSWIVDGTNTGTIAPATGSTLENTTRFNNVGSLLGGNDVDTFTVSANFDGAINSGEGNDLITVSGSVSGLINGDIGSDLLTITSAGDQTVQISDIDSIYSFTVTDIETITATGTTGNINGNTLRGSDADTVWTVNATPFLTYNSNTVNFSGFSNLTGGSAIDTFNISSNLTGTINGGDNNDSFNIITAGLTISSINGGNGDDTLTAANEDNYWDIDATGNSAIYASATDRSPIPQNARVSFTSIEAITGGSFIDDFNLTNPGGLTGLLDGAGGTSDLLTLITDGTTVQLGNRTLADAVADTNLNVTGIETINANSGIITDTLLADNSPNTWTIGTTTSVAGVNFTNFNVLTGGTSVDTFNISANFVGTLNGGNNADTSNDNFNFLTGLSGTTFSGIVNGGFGDDSFTLTGTGITFTNAINGDDGNDTLIAANEPNYWRITGLNQGNIYADSNRITQRIAFSNIESITGNNGVDDFLIDSSGSITQTISGGAGPGINSLTGRNSDNEWDITNTNAGALYLDNNGTGFSATPYVNNFTNIQNLVGGSASDAFYLTNSGVITGSIDGSSGTDTLFGRNSDNEWNVSSYNGGALYIDNYAADFGTAYVNAFSNIENLTGGSVLDRFVMGSTGFITGILDGGLSDNTLVARQGVANDWYFSSTTSGSLSQVAPAETYVSTFQNIQSFIGGGSADWANLASISGPFNVANYLGFTGVIGNGTNSTLTGIDGQANNWEISNLSTETPAVVVPITGTLDGTNDGIVNRGQAGQLYFIDFANLTGGNQDDVFTIEISGNVTGLINGGGGTSNTLNILNLTIPRVEIGLSGTTTNLNVVGLNSITGNGTTILVSDSTITNNWFLAGANSGTLNSIDFFNFASLEGGVNNDIFNLDSIIDFNGTINGGAGAGVDEIIASNRAVNNWVITNTSNTGTVTGITGGFSNIETLTGNLQQDIFSLHDSFDFIGSINGGGGTNDELRAGNRATNSWVITGTNNTGTVTGLTGNFTNIEILTGNVQQDIFTLHNTIDFAGSINGNDGINDELRAGNRAINTWTVTTANNTGTVTGLTGNFSAIETLTGNAQRDVFYLHNSIDFDGSINGAGGTNDEVIGGDRLSNIWSITGINNTGNVTGLTGTFSYVEQLTGNTGQDNYNLFAGVVFNGDIDGSVGSSNTLTAGSQPNNWTITGLDTGTVTGLGVGNTFSNIQNLNGSTGDDTFTFQDGASITGLISGGSQTLEDIVDMSALTTDISIRIGIGQNIYGIERIIGNNDGTGIDPESTLVGENNVNNWIINSTNTGSVDGINFENFNNLTGNTSDDIFTFSAAGNITGIIDGGAPNNVDWTPNGTWTPWTLGQPADRVYMNNVSNVDVQIGQDIINIELIVGSDTNNGILRFDSGTNNSNITGANAGIVNGTEFRQFSELIGNTGSDTFEVSTGGNISTIRGGSGNDTFVVQTGGTVTNIYGEGDDDSFDILGSVAFFDGGNGNDSIIFRDPNINFTVGDDLSGFEGVIAINGGTINARNNTITTWDINGGNSGNVSDTGITGPNSAPAENLTFSGFTTINGGNGTDIFNITSNGSVDGLVSGNSGTDTLNIDLSSRTLPSSQINFDGGGDAGDTVTITGTGNIYNEAYNPNQTIGTLGSFDQLRFTSTSVNFDLNIRAVANVNDNIQVNSLTLSSADPTNIFYLGTNSFGSANGLITTFDYANSSKDNMDVITLNGGDVQITGNVNIPGNLSITADNVTETTGSSITANTLLLLNTGTVGVSGDGLNTIINNLHINNAGSVYLDEQDALVLAELNASGLVNISAGGNITSNATLISSGALSLATTGNINLIGNNQLSNQLTFIGNNIVFNNNTATNLTGVSAANMNITSLGDITNSGTLLVTGTTTLASSGDIILDEATNNFATININDANTAMLVDIDSISGGQIIADNVNLQTSNGVGTSGNHLRTQTANLTINNQVSGGVYVDNNQAVTISITNMGDIDYTNTSGNVIIERLYTNGGDYTLIDPSLPSPLYTGDVRLEVQNGGLINAYTGPGSHSVLDAPDIVAENLTVFSQGDFGNPARYMSIRVHNEFAFFGARGFVYYYGAEPNVTSGVADLFDFSSLASGIFNQQLVEVESLAEIDPAIFTEIRNYSYDDVSIKMPADQRYDDEEEQK